MMEHDMARKWKSNARAIGVVKMNVCGSILNQNMIMTMCCLLCLTFMVGKCGAFLRLY